MVRKPLIGLSVALALCAACSKSPQEHSVQLQIAAHEAMTSGDKEAAVQKLSEALGLEQTADLYFQRAKLLAELGRDDDARSDVEKGLALEPTNEDFMWLLQQLKQAPAKRFQGSTQAPPSHRK